ncbi:zinc finger protein 513 isoform X2 [Scleropages formosus]|uniref:zinc finger protein 513 isoform X2 n=1 Tax=Scleropages formosus TaxID=113540 RepID=UPI0008787003|nr:zinc finger protein 513-like isoform X2 [Scleropages formosus]
MLMFDKIAKKRLSMSPLRDIYQDIQPVTLRLSEESATSSLYCSTAEGMEARVSTLVEAFLVEVYRCRVCQFTSSLKSRISTHVAERHDLAHTCHPLSCLDKGVESSLDVEVGHVQEELHRSTSPYALEDELDSTRKDREDPMSLERLPFLLPMYGMLQNISPRSCDMGLGPNAGVSHTCEVNTLFEEEEGQGNPGAEAAEFHLEDSSSVELPGPLSCPMGSSSPEAQDEEMAQSAHLMSLGLCRISSIKCLPRVGTPEPRSALAQPGQECSDTPLEENTLRRDLTEAQSTTEDTSLLCVLCHIALPTQSLLEVHLKCHNRGQGFSCPQCGWAAEVWAEMESHWKGHRKRLGSRLSLRPHRCSICPRTFQSADSRDAHQQRHRRRCKPLGQCARCMIWCGSGREFEQHGRCHVQGGFKCLHCNFTEETWEDVHTHMFSQHQNTEEQQRTGSMQSLKTRLPRSYDDSADASVLRDVKSPLEDWWDTKKKRRKKVKRGRRGRSGAGQKEVEVAPIGRRKGKSLKEFCCSLCDRKFTTKLTMQRHMGIHQGDKPFQCPQCPYSTRLKASLVQHLRVHTGEKPFKCTQCPYASIDSSSLLRHSRTHTQEKPHRCQHCPYSSIQKKSLDLHMRRHHTGESFHCHLCSYSTPNQQLLHRHLRKHHASAAQTTTASEPSAGALSPGRSSSISLLQETDTQAS